MRRNLLTCWERHAYAYAGGRSTTIRPKIGALDRMIHKFAAIGWKGFLDYLISIGVMNETHLENVVKLGANFGHIEIARLSLQSQNCEDFSIKALLASVYHAEFTVFLKLFKFAQTLSIFPSDVDDTGFNGASRCGNLRVMCFLKRKFDAPTVNQTKKALTTAIWYDQINSTKLLIAWGAEVTSMHVASARSAKMAKLLQSHQPPDFSR